MQKELFAVSYTHLATIISYFIKNDTFLKITQTKQHSFQNVERSRNFTCNNHNAFLQMMDGALSGKTGFTADAGYCYVGALKRVERTVVVSLLACGWPNIKSYKGADTRKLMEYGLEPVSYTHLQRVLSDGCHTVRYQV